MSTKETVIPTFTHRTHRAGGFLLVLAGIISAIIGLGLLMAAASGGLAAVGASSFVTGLIGGYVLVFGAIEFIAGVLAYYGEDWYVSMAGGILGMAGLVTLPLDLVGIILVALGEGQFEHPETLAVEATEIPSEEVSSSAASSD
ncbi:MAG: hypothetical protein ABEI77_03005 [Halorientalis sp.]